jgi:hypothetical protein
VLTSVESYQTCVQDVFNNGRVLTDPHTHQPIRQDGLAWARVWRDEAHLTPNWGTTLYTIFTSLVHNGGWAEPPAFYPLTGTPVLRNGILDMLPLIRCINMASPNLATDARYVEFMDHVALAIRAARLKRLTKRQVSSRLLCESDERQFNEDTAFFARLLARYAIRRRSSTIQNGKPLAYIPPLYCFDVPCALPSTTSLLPFR